MLEFKGCSMSRSDAIFTISDYESAEDGTSGTINNVNLINCLFTKLQLDFASLYADEVISLVVCGTKFSAHKSLLASKSPGKPLRF